MLGAEHFREAGIFIDANCHVDGCCSDELCEAGVYGIVGMVSHCGGYGIDCVCGEVG